MKIRVLEVLASLRRAGAERVAVSLAGGLDPDRFETEVVSLYGAYASGFEPVLEEQHIPTRHLGKWHGLDPRMYPRLAGAYRSFRPAIVHTHSYLLRYTWPAGWAGGLAGSGPAAGRMVHTVHNLARKEVDWLGRAIHRLAFRSGVIPVAVSGEVARSFREVYGFEPATIPNGVDTDSFHRPQARQPWRRAQGFSDEDSLVVSVARLEPQKNPLGLIESFARALRDHPRWHLLMAGDGSLREAAREVARVSGMAERVHFLGARDDVAEVLAASDVFVLASHWEGNPMSVMEAMAAGLPVVATAVGGVPELVEDGVTGLLAAPGNVQALAAALTALAANPQRRQELAAAARGRAARFSLGAMVSAYAELFERVVGRASTPAIRLDRQEARRRAWMPAPPAEASPYGQNAGCGLVGRESRLAARAAAWRVTLLSTNLARGGAETQVAQLAGALDRRGWTVSVVSLLDPSAFEAELTASGVRVFSLRMLPGRPNPLALLRLAAILRESRPHIVHAHLFHANLLARAIRLVCPAPVVISTIHSIAESGRASGARRAFASRQSTAMRHRDWLYRITDPLADATVSVSAAGAERYASIRAVSRRRLRVIPNAVDTTRFQPDAQRRARTRSALGIGYQFVWLAAGRLMWKKDYDTMLRAMARRRTALPAALGEEVLLIAGEGPQHAELHSLAGELGANVRFLGARDDMPDLMNASDGLLLSSVVEGLPMVLLEAAATGLPCVATDAGGVREAVLDGHTGYVVRPADPAAFAEAMARLAQLPAEARQRMADAAREHALARFDLAVVVEQWERLYLELLEAAATYYR